MHGASWAWYIWQLALSGLHNSLILGTLETHPSFNVAFQCKRYKGLVGASAIRDFRGSLTTDIEKGVLITTGAFSKAAREEASNPGKQQIDLIDGEELISKIAEFGIGVREVKSYEVDEEFFKKI